MPHLPLKTTVLGKGFAKPLGIKKKENFIFLQLKSVRTLYCNLSLILLKYKTSSILTPKTVPTQTLHIHTPIFAQNTYNLQYPKLNIVLLI